PRIARVAVLREPGPAGIGQWVIIQAVAQSLGVELKPIELGAAEGIERAISTFARSPNGGLITVVSGTSLLHRELLITLAARHQLPAVYPYRIFVTEGGLITYGATSPASTAAPPATSTASSEARSRATCRCRHRPSTIW